MPILISDKINWRTKKNTKRETLDIIKPSVHWEGTTIMKVYAPNKRASKWIKQKLTEQKILRNRQICEYSWELHIPLSTSWNYHAQGNCQTARTEKKWATNAISQQDLIDIHRKISLDNSRIHIFSCVPETFTKTENTLCHTTNVYKFKRIQIVQRAGTIAQ